MLDNNDWLNQQSRNVEQAEAGVETQASLASIYYKTLIGKGVPEPTAGYLTGQWLAVQIAVARGNIKRGSDDGD